MPFHKKIDRGVARIEGWTTVLVVLTMVLVAGFEALVRNLTRFDVHWANVMLTDMEWADSVLRKGTVWLAFIGASLATYSRKHIGIDVLVRMAPPRAKYVMRAVSGISAGMISMALMVSFWSAVSLNLTERPMEYEVLGDRGPVHLCDATAEKLAEFPDLDRPVLLCTMRSALSPLGIPVEAQGAAFQLIAPLMLGVIGCRLLIQGGEAAALVMQGKAAVERADAEERAAERAMGASVASLDPDEEAP